MKNRTLHTIIKTLIAGGLFLASAGIALAQSLTSASAVVYYITNLLQIAVVPLLLALGLVYFLIGVLKYVTAGGSEDKAKEGRNLMIYGIIALFVMISVFGLVQILLNTFSSGGAPGFQFAIPRLPSSQ